MLFFKLITICVLISSISAFSWEGIKRPILSLSANIFLLPMGFFKLLLESVRFHNAELDNIDVKNNSEYDFIIVGAGSAGAVVANRLTEISGVSVLLIEAGGHESKFYDIPGLASFLQILGINWDFRPEPSNDYCRGIRQNSCRWARGKVMGGSSTINFMIATRGNPKDYDDWSNNGNAGWSYQRVLPYFKKMERNIATSSPNYDPTVRGHDGPVTITDRYVSKVARAFVDAGVELGFEEIDYNGKKQIGFSRLQANIDEKGFRESSNVAYLHPIKDRKNLYITMESTVSKVIINRQSNEVEGVRFLKGGKQLTVRAKKEVILSAGALQSPQLLMLSGIGPKKHLDELGIDVISNSPGVGQNLMDHVTYFGHVFLINTTDTFIPKDSINPFKTITLDYLTKGKGVLGTPGEVEAIGFMNIGNKTDEMSNVELLYLDLSQTFDSTFFSKFILALKPEVYKAMYAKYKNKRAYQIMPVLLKPKSRGEVRLRSKDVNDYPIFNANYYQNADDISVMIEALKISMQLINTNALQAFDSKLVPELVYGCENFTFNSDPYWECALRTLTFTFWHFSGTAQMGPKTNPMAVVDERLKVRGVTGLRVIDCAIMPVVISGHTNVPAMMIGEKGADMIKEDWGLNVFQSSAGVERAQ